MKPLRKHVVICCIIFFIFICLLSGAGVNNFNAPVKDIEEINDVDRITGEYIVTFEVEGGKDLLYSIFGVYNVISIKMINKYIFMIKIENDPGLEIIRNNYLKENGIDAPGKFWQRNYYEHVIRNEKELDEIREYTMYNANK